MKAQFVLTRILSIHLAFLGLVVLVMTGCDKDGDRAVIDEDEDGYPDDEDCDDGNELVHPGALEVCDGIDNDCDGETDEADAADTSVWYADVDGDNHGDDDSTIEACNAPADYVAIGGDCDDTTDAAHPDAMEVCDGIDNDCDDDVDEADATDAVEYFVDADDDGHGSSTDAVFACTMPSGYATTSDDCDDAEAESYPGNTEVCDDIDNDCDDVIDTDAVDIVTWYSDADEDGYGLDDTTVQACTRPALHSDVGGDCDDADDAVNPGADEVCDDIDNDCDDSVDPATAIDAPTWYFDLDDDGYGDDAVTEVACDNPGAYVLVGGDCDDSDMGFNPGMDEICENGEDEDCTGVADDGCPIRHCGSISADETWDATTPHLVTCTTYVQSSGSPTLTIEDGALVMFDPGVELIIGNTNYGRLVVNGHTLGVTFTSSQSSPAAGDWGGVLFNMYDDGSILRGLTVQYGGDNGYGNLFLWGSQPTFNTCTSTDSSTNGMYVAGSGRPLVYDSTFGDNAADGVFVTADSGLSRSSTPSFTNNTLTDNGGFAMTVPANYVGELDGNLTISGNSTDRIQVLADVVDTTATWRPQDVPYRVTGTHYIQAAGRPVVTIEDGAELLFDHDAELIVGNTNYGSLVVNGTTVGVVFSADDPMPTPGFWRGILFNSYDDGSSVTGATISYAGGNGFGGVYLWTSDPVFDGCTVSFSSHDGVYAASSSFPTFTDSSFTDNVEDGFFADASSGLDRPLSGLPSFTGNTLTRNGGWAMTLPGDYVGMIDATSSFTGNTGDAINVLADVVATDATWQSQDVDYHFNGTTYIQASSHPIVTIEDGASFTFFHDAELIVGNTNYGRMIVDGHTAGVTFGSDESISPTPGHWRGILFNSYDDGSSITGATISHAGGNGYGALYLWTSDPVFDDCSVSFSINDGMYAASGSFPKITDSSFTDNLEDGIYIDASSGLDRTSGPTFTSNTLTRNGGWAMTLPADYVGQLDSSSTFSGNTDEAINVLADVVTTDATWQDLDADYHFTGNSYIQGAAHPAVIIQDGSTLTFDTGAELIVGNTNYGSLSAIGTTLGITFTSAAASPAAGDWRGILLNSYCDDADTIFDNVTVEYAGGNGYGNVYWWACSGTITNSEVTNSSNYGIYRASGADPTIAGISYASNASGDLF